MFTYDNGDVQPSSSSPENYPWRKGKVNTSHKVNQEKGPT